MVVVVQPAAGGGGGPTLIASDNFDAYSNAAALDGAANWTLGGGADGTIFKPASDGSVSPGITGCTYFSGASFSADQRAEVTIEAVATGGSFQDMGPAVRCQVGAATCYAAVFTASDLRLISINAGTPAVVIDDTGMTLVAGNKIAIECSGWVTKWSNQNPAVDIDGGKPGTANFSQSSGTGYVDEWKGYDL